MRFDYVANGCELPDDSGDRPKKEPDPAGYDADDEYSSGEEDEGHHQKVEAEQHDGDENDQVTGGWEFWADSEKEDEDENMEA